MMISLFLLALALSFFLELPVKPRPLLFKRPFHAIILHAVIFSIFFLIFFLLSRRPIFSGIAVLCGQALIVAISNAKFVALREPLVASDLILFTQAIKHPRLYLPFLGIIPAATALIIGVTVIYGCLTLETAYFDYALINTADFSFFITLTITLLLLFHTLSNQASPTLDPLFDINKFGLFSTLAIYFIQSFQHENSLPKDSFFNQSPGILKNNNLSKNKTDLPHIVTIQSESFFDARLLHNSIKPSILKNFDAAITQAQQHGRLVVPAWGAYTMRTEFSFLTGIPNHKLGFNRFDPYQRLTKKNIPTLAHYLSSIGYKCICIHPHSASFFGRDKIFPKLGFDTFIDIAAFDESQKNGPYIGDAAVTEKILQIINEASDPLFIFAITMENHGPLHLEKTGQDDEAQIYQSPPPANFHDLTVYLRHLKNADNMIGDLTSALKQMESDSILCLFGDHVPSMPKVYDATEYNDAQTDYFIWTPSQTESIQQDLSIESLAEQIVTIMHNIFSTNSANKHH